jgi:hypothetical protein
MDHTAVVREKTTEKYLLNELDPKTRDEFEEHYFDCLDCAQDVSAGAQFVEQSKAVLAEPPEPIPARSHIRPVSRGVFAWLRPAFAVPVLALLLAVVGYQNLVTYPRLQSELNRPRVLPTVFVNTASYGAEETIVPEGNGLLLSLRISPDTAISYTRYTAELYNPAGKSEGSFTITPAAGQDQWPVTVPEVHREAGTYTLALHGVTSSGETKDLGSPSFQLQIQR